MPLQRSRRPAMRTTPLRSALEAAAHVCSLYNTPEDCLELVGEFVEVGMARDEKCLCLVSQAAVDSFRRTICASGFRRVARGVAAGAIEITALEGAYSTDPERFTRHALDFWSTAAERARSAGFSGLRGVVQADRHYGDGATLVHWIDYESRLTQTLSQSGSALLCLYNRRAHPAEFVRELLRCHAVVAHRGRVGENAFHVPLSEYEAPDRADREVDRMLSSLSAVWESEARSLARELREREQEQRGLRRRIEYLTLGQKITRTGSWAWNPSSGDLFWSREHFRIFGVYPLRTEVSYDLFFGMVHPEERAHVEREFLGAVRAGRDVDLEYRIVCQDGEVKYIHGRAHPVFGSSGELTEYVGTVEDITERRHGEESLSNMQSELARATRAITLGQLMASIAHEVNQPLAALIANAGAGLRWLAGEKPRLGQARQALTRIVRDGNRASEVIARIRALVRRADAERNFLDLNGVIEDVIALLKTELRKNKIVLKTRLGAQLPSVWGDKVQLQQVLLNLIMNAIESMSAVATRTRLLTIATRSDGAGVSVRIKDRGVGLDKGSLERVFEPFYTTKPHGMGIGLAISRTIVETHGGLLWATCNRGPGAMFEFRLPTARAGAGEVVQANRIRRR
jgi:PAS domain S-box-containing protein